MKTLTKISVSVLAGFLLIGCGGGSSDTTTPTVESKTITGQFIDSPVENLIYECSSGLLGTTNANGDFTCNDGDTVTFKVGELILGSALAKDVLTPFHLYPDDLKKAYNVSQLLHSLDDNSNPDDGIKLIAGLVLDGVNVEADSQTFQNELASVLASVSRTNFDRDEAKAKMLDYIATNGRDTHYGLSLDVVSRLLAKLIFQQPQIHGQN